MQDLSLFRLVDPEPSAGEKDVVIRRGHLITLSINFPRKEGYPHTSIEHVKIPVPIVEEQGPHDDRERCRGNTRAVVGQGVAGRAPGVVGSEWCE